MFVWQGRLFRVVSDFVRQQYSRGQPEVSCEADLKKHIYSIYLFVIYFRSLAVVIYCIVSCAIVVADHKLASQVKSEVIDRQVESHIFSCLMLFGRFIDVIG